MSKVSCLSWTFSLIHGWNYMDGFCWGESKRKMIFNLRDLSFEKGFDKLFYYLTTFFYRLLVLRHKITGFLWFQWLILLYYVRCVCARKHDFLIVFFTNCYYPWVEEGAGFHRLPSLTFCSISRSCKQVKNTLPSCHYFVFTLPSLDFHYKVYSQHVPKYF